MALPKFYVLLQVVLYELYLVVTGGKSDGRDQRSIFSSFLDSRIPENYVKKICNQLVEEGLISNEIDEEVPSEVGNKYYAITGKGIRNVEDQLDNPNSILRAYAEGGKDWLFSSATGKEDDSPLKASGAPFTPGSSVLSGGDVLGGAVSKEVIAETRDEDQDIISVPALRSLSNYHEESQKTQRQRLVLIGALEISSQVYGLKFVNLAKAVEEYDDDQEILLRDESGSLWLDNDGEQAFSKCILDLKNLGFIEVETREGSDWRDQVFACVTELGSAYWTEFTGKYASNQMMTVGLKAAPASDRIVSLDHNNPEFKEAEEKFKSAAEAIRGFNEPTGYDKEELVKELNFGQQLLEFFKDAKVRVATAAALLLAPLYTAFHDEAALALRPIIKEAIDAIKIWLGII